VSNVNYRYFGQNLADLFPGRTTFVNTLCGKNVLKHKDSDDPVNAHMEEGVKIKPVTVGTFGCAEPTSKLC